MTDLLTLADAPLTLKGARAIAGSLGSPSKMPGHSYGLPISACNVGSRLRAQGPGVNGAGFANPCGSCYAAEGFYRRFAKTVIPAQERRLAAITHPRWEDAMVTLIAHTGDSHFRWHDSGDLQSAEHLSRIVRIAERLPEVSFWIPTREARLVKEWQETNGAFPPNLAVRISTMARPSERGLAERLYSTVSADTAPEGAYPCPAAGKSGDANACDAHGCRACWSTDVPWIDYHLH